MASKRMLDAGGAPTTASGEMRLFVMALRPHWSLERMAARHEELVEQLESQGPEALRDHLRAGRESVLDAQDRW